MLYSQLHNDYSRIMICIPDTIPDTDSPEVFLEKHDQRLEAIKKDFEGDFESGKLTLVEYARLVKLYSILKRK